MTDSPQDDVEDALLKQGAVREARSRAALSSSRTLIDGLSVDSDCADSAELRGYANLAEWDERDQSHSEAKQSP